MDSAPQPCKLQLHLSMSLTSSCGPAGLQRICWCSASAQCRCCTTHCNCFHIVVFPALHCNDHQTGEPTAPDRSPCMPCVIVQQHGLSLLQLDPSSWPGCAPGSASLTALEAWDVWVSCLTVEFR